MPTHHIPRHLVLAAAALASLALAGCGSLHDERYNWCQGQNCAVAQVVAPAPAAAPAAPMLRRVNLSADTLFVFDRSSAADMLPQGKAELDALARALRGQEMQVQSLVITGHTDRLGDAAYNDALALQRANTVADYLKAQGVGAPMQVKAMGEREPVTTGCKGDARTAALIACLQPDRRVSVDIHGMATTP
ncbi:OmpA family protein [Variovorax arabinosiphilus]|uniref:OmpA family protein n=1 Tax=Variovorax arabinosiphilus TaxID=3053498 RepID=UPI0025781AFE|nr:MULTISPECIES: OmpA family protein [unclassified Variovorax]MDM0118564.1 OmpA family protein [Variovorax sp. J2L1-78]MDM0128989.1 OmpA family protein [Variovorax sp. J2L1-63]MDM0233224.1 OmpA family protein [Variovorax sp. J2R1-6]